MAEPRAQLLFGFIKTDGDFEAGDVALLRFLESVEVPKGRVHGLFVGIEIVPKFVESAELFCARHLMEWKQSIHAGEYESKRRNEQSKQTPFVAVLGEELVGFFGAPGAGGVFAHGGWGVGFVPGGLDFVDELPGIFDFVAPGEEGGITGHGVKEEALVGFRAGFAEAGGVAEVHLHGLHGEGLAGLFAEDAEGHAFVGLDADDEGVFAVVDEFAGGEGDLGGAFEVDGDFGGLFGELFADANVEGDALPAPGVDEETECDVSFGLGFRIDAVFLSVAGAGDAIDGTAGVLGANDVLADGVWANEGAEGADDLDFFIADGIGAEVCGGLHSDEAEELEKVVLDHVAQGTGGVVVAAAAAFHAEVFGAGDLDVIDVAGVPVRFEDGVGEAQDHDVLGGFFAQVMVDAVGVLFGEGVGDGFVEAAGGGEVFAEGFFTDDAGPFAFGGMIEAGGFEVFEDGFEELGGGGEVEEAVGGGAAFGVELVEEAAQGFVAFDILELALMVVNGLRETGPEFLGVGLAGVFFIGGFEFGAEDFVAFFTAGEADDFELRGEIAAGCDVVECGDEFAVGEIASGTKDDDGAGLGAVFLDEGFLEGVFHERFLFGDFELRGALRILSLPYEARTAATEIMRGIHHNDESTND